MTSVVDVVNDGEEDNGGKNPFDGDRIEIPEKQLRAVSRHVVVLGAIKQRLNN
jgi:hypothetical protein